MESATAPHKPFARQQEIIASASNSVSFIAPTAPVNMSLTRSTNVAIIAHEVSTCQGETMDNFEKKILVAMVVLFVVIVIGISVALQILKQATEEVDSHGGLKAFVERVWEGKK